jgi:hypothetical protein
MTAVRQWLESLGLGQYAEPFEIEEIEIADLRDLTEADLERLGLPWAREAAAPGDPRYDG